MVFDTFLFVFFSQKAANNTKCKSILFVKAELEEATVSAHLIKPVIKKHWRCKFRHVQSLSLRRLSHHKQPKVLEDKKMLQAHATVFLSCSQTFSDIEQHLSILLQNET